MPQAFARTSFASIVQELAELPSGFLCLLVDEDRIVGSDAGTATLRTDVSPPEAHPNIAKLVVYPIDPLSRRFTIGRSSKCDVVILDRRVSSAHVSLEPAYPRTFWLTDLGSSNGTSVAGRPVARGQEGRVMLNVGATFLMAGVPVGLIDKQQAQAIAQATP